MTTNIKAVPQNKAEWRALLEEHGRPLLDEMRAKAREEGRREGLRIARANSQNNVPARAVADKEPSSRALESQGGAGFPDPAVAEQLDARCKTEWDSSAAIRCEFGAFEHFRCFRQAEAAGRVRIAYAASQTPRTARPFPPPAASAESVSPSDPDFELRLDAESRAIWDRDLSVRREFLNFDGFKFYRRAEMRGRVRVNAGCVTRLTPEEIAEARASK